MLLFLLYLLLLYAPNMFVLLQYIQLYQNNDATPGTGGMSIPRDNLDLTDLGAVKIVLPESYSQNFDGTGTMTIRGMR